MTGINPYPGLRPYQSSECKNFFGREEEIGELLWRLHSGHFLAVVGPSGCGKSSLVHAGMIPLLEQGFDSDKKGSWKIVKVRPRGNPLKELAASLRAIIDNPNYGESEFLADLNVSSRGVAEVSRKAGWPDGTKLFILVDQFEELFTIPTEREEASVFVEQLLAAAWHCPTIHITITLRSDENLGRCSNFPGLSDAINRGLFLVPRLSREQLVNAISGPVRGKISQSLISRLLADLDEAERAIEGEIGIIRNESEDDNRDNKAPVPSSAEQEQSLQVGVRRDCLPILQHAMMQVWAKWSEEQNDPELRSEILELRHYQKAGEMRSAITNHVEECIAMLSEENQKIARHLFLKVASIGKNKQANRQYRSIFELGDTLGLDQQKVVPLVEHFRSDGRSFLEPTPMDVPNLQGNSEVSVSHESLIRQWDWLYRTTTQRSRDLEALQLLRLSAIDWDQSGKKEEHLSLSEEQLEQFQSHKRSFPEVFDSEPTKSFISATEELLARQRRELEAQLKREEMRKEHERQRVEAEKGKERERIEEKKEQERQWQEKMREQERQRKEKEMLAAKEQEKRSAVRRLQWIAAGLGFAAVVLVFAVLFFNAKRKAAEEIAKTERNALELTRKEKEKLQEALDEIERQKEEKSIAITQAEEASEMAEKASQAEQVAVAKAKQLAEEAALLKEQLERREEDKIAATEKASEAENELKVAEEAGDRSPEEIEQKTEALLIARKDKLGKTFLAHLAQRGSNDPTKRVEAFSSSVSFGGGGNKTREDLASFFQNIAETWPQREWQTIGLPDVSIGPDGETATVSAILAFEYSQPPQFDSPIVVDDRVGVIRETTRWDVSSSGSFIITELYYETLDTVSTVRQMISERERLQKELQKTTAAGSQSHHDSAAITGALGNMLFWMYLLEANKSADEVSPGRFRLFAETSDYFTFDRLPNNHPDPSIRTVKSEIEDWDGKNSEREFVIVGLPRTESANGEGTVVGRAMVNHVFDDVVTTETALKYRNYNSSEVLIFKASSSRIEDTNKLPVPWQDPWELVTKEALEAEITKKFSGRIKKLRGEIAYYSQRGVQNEIPSLLKKFCELYIEGGNKNSGYDRSEMFASNVQKYYSRGPQTPRKIKSLLASDRSSHPEQEFRFKTALPENKGLNLEQKVFVDFDYRESPSDDWSPRRILMVIKRKNSPLDSSFDPKIVSVEAR